MKRINICSILFIALLAVGISALFVKDNRMRTKTTAKEASEFQQSDSENVCFKIESRSDEGDVTYLTGWFVDKGKVLNDFHVACSDGEYVYELPTRLENRDDVTKTLADGVDYLYCGFRVMIEKKYLDMAEANGLFVASGPLKENQNLYNVGDLVLS
ncbi:MAG TPA: hypothetical protein PLN48_05030 [Lachnospiraceae bacterium]|nr:hypothetical protein [Lachnospiraceae bacterium]